MITIRLISRRSLGLFLWSSFCLFALVARGIYAQSQSAFPNREGAAIQYRSPISSVGQQEPQSIDAALAADETLVQSGHLAGAEKDVRTYLSKHANSADGHFLLGYVLYREDKPTDSLAEYTLGASFRKPHAGDLAVVAMDYVLLRDYADADKWLTKATVWQPENALYWYYLGRTKYNENHFHEAIEAFTKSLALHPRDVRAEYNLGLSYVGLGLNDAAETAYRNAIAWQQNAEHQDPQPYLDLGILLAQQGHGGQAISQLQRAAGLDPKNPRAHEELGRVDEQMHQLTSAQTELETAVSLAPNVPGLHFELGRIYQKEGMSVRAKSEFARCAVLNGTHSTDSAETPNLDFHN